MLELAREVDFEQVSRLALQIHQPHVAWRPDIYCDTTFPYPKEKFLEDISKRMVYVAKVDEFIAGFLVLSKRTKSGEGLVSKDVLVLESICVDEAFRGQGIGRTMLSELRLLARVFRCQEVILSVYPENDGAIAFYQKCGFFIRSINMDMKV